MRTLTPALLVLAASVSPTAAAGGGARASDALAPRIATLAEHLEQRFDRRWVLPPRDDDDGDFSSDLEALAESGWFGDLAARALDARALDAALRELRDADGDVTPISGDDAARARVLLLDQGLRSGAWDPAVARADDGFLFGPTIDLRERSDRRPWNALDGSASLFQAAVLIRADLVALKTAEGDYPAYLRNVGADYEWIRPVAWSRFRSEDAIDAEGAPAFDGMAMEFESDLPFPFTTYSCRVHILNRLDDRGRLRTDVYSTSPDFHWLAGDDLHLPVLDPDGDPVALLMIRRFGFDLDGVPDGDDDRRAALRGGLGNLKLRAERRHAARGARDEREDQDGRAPLFSGAIPRYEVRGN